MKITRKQLQSLITEEAKKIKNEAKLQNRKKAILKEMHEMYNDMEEGELEELFGIGKKKVPAAPAPPDRAKLSAEITGIVQKRIDAYKAKTGKVFPMPNWATAGTPENEKAIDAAIELNTTDIVWNSGKNTFTPKSYSATSHGFGGGNKG